MPVIKLTISFVTEDGAVNVEGPIDNTMLSYGLLECAKVVLQEHARQNRERRVQIATGPLPSFPGTES